LDDLLDDNIDVNAIKNIFNKIKNDGVENIKLNKNDKNEKIRSRDVSEKKKDFQNKKLIKKVTKEIVENKHKELNDNNITTIDIEPK